LQRQHDEWAALLSECLLQQQQQRWRNVRHGVCTSWRQQRALMHIKQ
jgi:hypothetical protein